MRIVLLDASGNICRLWKQELRRLKKEVVDAMRWGDEKLEVSVFNGDIEELKLDTNKETKKETVFFSPGNSFGGMGGGYDRALACLFSDTGDWKTTDRYVKKWIVENSQGYSAPGTARLIRINTPNSTAWRKYRASAILHIPTMRTPESLAFSDEQTIQSVFDWTWQSLVRVRTEPSVDVFVLTGMGTGTGGLAEWLVCRVMVAAIAMFGNRMGKEVLSYLDSPHRSIIEKKLYD
ncbi:hypothetical protein KL918_001374 [Ogataea parapolymorpha]|uniref:Macro-like domain-containing protein n=1 Tax=Ogataea parapolymorpha (strain ATCC 26012 / BCRC 20466 / JCM 22074 / NRRL Y-7560 / DL-1) TaxID=871575 RepID=W1QE00_OGAPD|nr:hypothetical protein HPODL_03567 [Ogataea parapolymorpha DL-1]ESW99693.1 hypothetical protein HPODL_03567 [Ogataea parapolymorpha DL-1]KAG7868731.1 hypothetical protein KL918_001374 [Ogataea parapolymorpha]KAG7874488.1 hypothetical protein KL916_001254 [Ogataea parapolymorpha]